MSNDSTASVSKKEPVIVEVTDPDLGVLIRLLLEKVTLNKWEVKYSTPGPHTPPERVAWRVEARRK